MGKRAALLSFINGGVLGFAFGQAGLEMFWIIVLSIINGINSGIIYHLGRTDSESG